MTFLKAALAVLLLAPWVLSAPASADPAPFDLLGPSLKVSVGRAGLVLPIAETPNLAPGDLVQIRADLPAGQSVRYLMVAAFLRGATNPPPEDWFSKAETWTRAGRSGLKIAVPAGAEQLVVLLAPTAGGDFKTIVEAVRSRPGAFIRAAQDLNQASLDRSRLDAYLAAIRASDPSDAGRLLEISPLLARSLAIKLNSDCLKKEAALQAPCLTENQATLVLADTHSTSIVQALTSGSSADLIQQLSVTPRAGSGYYSPYVGAVMDIARILDSFHSAQYQYLPALTLAKGEDLALVLNTPPSFTPPLSVLMAAFPPVEAPRPPPLKPVDPKSLVCLAKPGLVLPVDGAPLVFSTRYAHDLKLRVELKEGRPLEIPLRPDAERGGLALSGPVDGKGGEAVGATLVGRWGFAPFEGPRFQVALPGPGRFSVSNGAGEALVAARDEEAVLRSPRAPCVDSVALKEAGGESVPVKAVLQGPDALELQLPLKPTPAGALILSVRQFGLEAAEEIEVRAYPQARRAAAFEFYAGDGKGRLTGTRLEEVEAVVLDGVEFRPDGPPRLGAEEALALTPNPAEAAAKLQAGQRGLARVAWKDGGAARLKVEVGPARPAVLLLSKSAEPDDPARIVRLSEDKQLRQGATLTFSIAAKTPEAFPSDLAVEIAAADGAPLTRLTLKDGLVLEDAKIAVARLDTERKLNPSTFGSLTFRVLAGGAESAWQPLATLVRVPALKELRCGQATQGCELSGSNLFLIDEVSNDPGFVRSVKVPEGYTGAALQVPRPKAGRRLYLRLHDDASVVDEAVFPEARGPRAPLGRTPAEL